MHIQNVFCDLLIKHQDPMLQLTLVIRVFFIFNIIPSFHKYPNFHFNIIIVHNIPKILSHDHSKT